MYTQTAIDITFSDNKPLGTRGMTAWPHALFMQHNIFPTMPYFLTHIVSPSQI